MLKIWPNSCQNLNLPFPIISLYSFKRQVVKCIAGSGPRLLLLDAFTASIVKGFLKTKGERQVWKEEAALRNKICTCLFIRPALTGWIGNWAEM